MDWTLFATIIEQLTEVGYGGFLAFHNYNEPLLSDRILDEIRHVRRELSQAKPAIYTNGDVLDAALFGELLDAGVAYLRVTRYPRRADTAPTYAAIKGWLHRKGLADALAWTFGPVRQGLAATFESPTVKVEVIAPKILDAYNNRGGSVTPCLCWSSRVPIRAG